MKMIGGWIASILGVLSITLACAGPSIAGPTLPLKKSSFPGRAIQLKSGEWKQLNGVNRAVTCDIRPERSGISRVNRPGTRLSGPGLRKGSIWFISLNSQAQVYRTKSKSRKLSRKKKRKLRNEATRLRGLSKKLAAACVAAIPSTDPDPDPDGLKFNFKGASALATVTGSTKRAASYLQAPSESGLLAWGVNQPAFDPLISGQLNGSILMMNLAPDNDLLFIESGDLMSSNGCQIDRVDYETGEVSCWSQHWLTYLSKVRFDAAGNGYFWATGSGSNSGTFFKKIAPDGTSTDVIDPAVVSNLVKTLPNHSIGDIPIPFEVSPNGDVLMVVGEKLRRIKNDGSLEVISHQPAELCGFSGGKLFLISEGQMFTYTPGSSSLDSPAWLGPPGSGATHLTSEIASYFNFPCFSHQLSDGALIGAVGRVGFPDQFGQPTLGWGKMGNPTSLFEYFPTPRILNIEVDAEVSNRVSVSKAGSKVIIHRTDSNNQMAVDIYDHTSNTSKSLLAPTGDLKVLHMAYSPGDGLIYFDGINYETFQNFLGTIDPETGELNYLDDLDGDLETIFAFE
ncbi:MAG TPA: hypothetical protein PKL95_06905 [Solirubrobacterales bacterium]|nr:hypothetical protein [Solirubrobacterales bacterium]